MSEYQLILANGFKKTNKQTKLILAHKSHKTIKSSPIFIYFYNLGL